MNTIYPNAHLKVRQPMKVWTADKNDYVETNCWYGASRISQLNWKETTAKRGNIIDWLYGGLFLNGKHLRLSAPKSPFEKEYGYMGDLLAGHVRTGELEMIA